MIREAATERESERKQKNTRCFDARRLLLLDTVLPNLSIAVQDSSSSKPWLGRIAALCLLLGFLGQEASKGQDGQDSASCTRRREQYKTLQARTARRFVERAPEKRNSKTSGEARGAASANGKH